MNCVAKSQHLLVKRLSTDPSTELCKASCTGDNAGRNLKKRVNVNRTFFFFTTVLSQWDFSHGKFGFPSPGKDSYDMVALPKIAGMLGVLVFA